MTALPRIKGTPESWRARRDQAMRDHRNSSYAQRNFVIAKAHQIRAELRQERKGQAS